MGKKQAIVDNEKINPLGWGILFFAFWGLALTMPSLKQQPSALVIGWLSFAGSMLMLIALVPCIRDWLSKPQIKKWIVLVVFYITLMGNFITFFGIIGDIGDAFRLMAIIFVLIWSTVYIAIFASSIPIWAGVIGFVIAAMAGFHATIGAVTMPDKWITGIIFSVLATLILACSLNKPKWLAEIPTI